MTEPGTPLPREIEVDQSGLPGRSGRGIRIAVIDSGVHPGHPHVGGLAGAVAIRDDGSFHADALDRLGHGTAIAAAIHEKAPSAELLILKVFHETLSTSLEALLLALEAAAERGARLINLSLGTANPSNAAALSDSVEGARAMGAIVLSAASHAGRAWFPGSLRGVVGVTANPGCPRSGARFTADGPLLASASPYARPIPGVPPERNLNGVSFAVANTTGILACLLEEYPGTDSIEDLASAVRRER
jgi:subtilisin family serine protease